MSFNSILSSILTSYSCFNQKQITTASPLGKLDAAKLIQDIRTLVFPEYFIETMSVENSKEVITPLLDCVQNQLKSAFSILEVYESKSTQIKKNNLDRICEQFLLKLPSLREQLEADAQFFKQSDPACDAIDEIIVCYPGFYAVLVYRIAHEMHQLDFLLLARRLSEEAHQKVGVDIHPQATIGVPFFMDHATGIVVGQTTTIGKRVKLYQGVTLGALSTNVEDPKKKRHPTLEDDVTVYANATILGGNTVIGAGSTIGGNVWLTKSVEKGTKVIVDPNVYQKEILD